MAKQRGLGRGLEALIPAPTITPSAPSSEGPYRRVPLDSIVASPWQPRRNFDEQGIEDLAQSIREQGLVQPLVVRERDGKYELVAGERRFRALRLLEREEAPVVVMDASDHGMRELALVENIQRADLNPLEIAAAYRSLIDENSFTHEKLSQRVGVSRAQVTNTLRLMELPEEVKQMVAGGELSSGHARAILSLDDPLAQLRLARQAVAAGWSVREVERRVAPRSRDGKEEKAPAKVDPHAADLVERLRRHLGCKVEVEDRGGKGRIILEYYSVEDAQRLIERMGLPEE